MSIYHSVAKEVNKLNAVRDRQGQEGMISGSSSITNEEPAAVASSSRRGSVTGKGSSLREAYTPGVDEAEKKDLGDAVRPGLALDGRTTSIDSSASSSTARQSVDPADDEDDDLQDGMVSGESSRNVSAASTPYEERTVNLDRFAPPRTFSSSRQSPALSPALEQEEYTGRGEPKTPKAFQQQLDTSEEDPVVDEVSAQMEQQHISQVEVKPPSETNRVDQVLNDVFGLLSLFFLTIGKTKESPGVYCQIASMRVGFGAVTKVLLQCL